MKGYASSSTRFECKHPQRDECKKRGLKGCPFVVNGCVYYDMASGIFEVCKYLGVY